MGVASGQTNLHWANGFLTLVNVIGVWRWLGLRARFDGGGAAAAERSARTHVPTLFSTAALVGSKVTGLNGDTIGPIVDAMAQCNGAALAYVVVSEGGVVGIGERLHALDPAQLVFEHDGVRSELDAVGLATLPVLDPDHWPERLFECKAG